MKKVKIKEYVVRAAVDIVGIILCVIAYAKHTPFPADPPKYLQNFSGKIIALTGLVFVLLFIRNCKVIRYGIEALSAEKEDCKTNEKDNMNEQDT